MSSENSGQPLIHISKCVRIYDKGEGGRRGGGGNFVIFISSHFSVGVYSYRKELAAVGAKS